MNKCKLMEKILVKNNPNRTGGHDPDVARHLLKTGRLPDRGPDVTLKNTIPKNVLIPSVPDTPLFKRRGVPPREYTNHEITPGL